MFYLSFLFQFFFSKGSFNRKIYEKIFIEEFKQKIDKRKFEKVPSPYKIKQKKK